MKAVRRAGGWQVLGLLVLLLGMEVSAQQGPIIDGIDGDTVADEGERVPYQGRAHSSQPGDLVYTWDWGDGSPMSVGHVLFHTWADDGTFTVTLTVRDSAGASTTTSFTVRVRNLAPETVKPEDKLVYAGHLVTSHIYGDDAAGSADPITKTLLAGPGTLMHRGDYLWIPGTGDVGIHEVRVRVADDDGGQSTVSFKINVLPPSAPEDSGGCSAMPGTGAPVLLALLSLVALARRGRRAPSP